MSPDSASDGSAHPVLTRQEALELLSALAEGLVYSSESDHPFRLVHLANDAPELPLTEERLRTLLQLPETTPLRISTISRVLARHTDLTHPDDHRAQAMRPRYEQLQHGLEDRLRNPVALRVGDAPAIAVWLLGQTADGELVGYRTVTIET